MTTFTITIADAPRVNKTRRGLVYWVCWATALLLLTLIGLAFGTQGVVVAQTQGTALTAGDIAILGHNVITDEFAFVLLAPITTNTQIKFTDSGWQVPTNTLRSGEGTILWTAPAGGLNVGTVVTYLRTGDTVNLGTVSRTGSFDLAQSDQLVAYQGNSNAPIFLFAVDWNGTNNGWDNNAIDSNTSALPIGLVNGSSAIAHSTNIRNGVVNTTTATSCTAALSIVASVANWIGGTTSQLLPSSFTINNTSDCTSISADNITSQISRTRTGASYIAPTFTLTYTYINNSAGSRRTFYYKVLSASNGTLFQNADGGAGGVDAVKSVANSALPGGNELWDNGESLTGQVLQVGVPGSGWSISIGVFATAIDDVTAREGPLIDVITLTGDQLDAELVHSTVYMPLISR